MPPRTTPARRSRRWWNRLPLRIRLVAGFAAAMLLVLTGAGAFVYLRVQYALDLRLDEDLTAQSSQLVHDVTTHTPPTVAPGSSYQLLDAGNRVLAGSSGLARTSLLLPAEAAAALRRPVREDRGDLFPITAHTLRLYAVPLHPVAAAPGQPAIAVIAVRRDQRDEALRELIGQLTLANLAALAVASLVGYRLARAALAPVERYRTEAARIAAGAAGVRLDVPDAADDEITRLGRTLNDMLTALEAALERERRFVNDASHELRTPLTLLSAELELALRRPRTTHELEQTIRNAAADTTDLVALADALLTVGVPPPVDNGDLVHLSPLAADIAAHYPGVIVDSASPAVVHGDAIRLRQVVTNLLDNATRHGAPPITITINRDGDTVVLAVHDAGAGITPDFLPHATDRFTRADTARTTPGTGLGLSLVAATVDAHHGQLRICSNHAHHHSGQPFRQPCTHPDAGTTVTLLLPANPKPS